MMQVLTAHNPRGYLHAVACIQLGSAYTAECFTRTQQAQGCTVAAHTLAEYLAQVRHSQSAEKPALTQAIGTFESTRTPPLDKNHEKTTPENEVLAQENQASGLIPRLGENLVHPVIGYATVTHFLNLEGQQVAVAAGPRGAGLVRPGEWRPATDTDKPFWMRGAADVSNKAPISLQVQATCKEILQIPSAIPAAQGTRMVSLFDLGGGA